MTLDREHPHLRSASAAPAGTDLIDGPPIRVAIHDNWRDVPEALDYLTPRGSGSWGRVTFGSAADIADPDFILVFNSPPSDVVVECPPERLWFACGEPPTRYHAPMHVGQGEGTVVLTCDERFARHPELSRQRTYMTTLPMLRTWSVRRRVGVLDRMADVPKSRDLSWVTSNLLLVPGHHDRMRFLEALRREVPFDLFGRGFAPIDDKWDGVAPYRYSIAFENCIHPFYFSEKIMDCFACLTMPIYVGSPAIGQFFPPESFVAIDPADPGVFERIREVVASDRRERSLDHLRNARRLVLARYNLFLQIARLMARRLAPPSPARRFALKRVRLGLRHRTA
ncbi:MAG: glycosyltransferase family 10 [Alphaproteobacteria bacterium]